jgi:cysteine desulfurase
LRALGLSGELARSSIRLSLGRFTTEEQVNKAATIICSKINQINQINK